MLLEIPAWLSALDVLERIGLGMQLVGAAITVGALISEFRRKRELHVEPFEEPNRRRRNPWDREPGHNVGSAGHYAKQFARWQKTGDPEIARVVAYNDAWLDERVEFLAEDWDDQAEHDAELRRSLVGLVNEQIRLLSQDQRDTRKRVLAEMAGLVLVAVGTTVGALGG